MQSSRSRTSPILCGLLAVALGAPAALPAQTNPRLTTNRERGAELLRDRLPKEDDAFGFIVFGDRTGGPTEGIEVLKQAVADTNLLDPDLVLTVGDLINGYNTREPWMAQAREYNEAMAELRMPWFPVAGNHDIYWRGKGRPPEEHERDYETVFGPLWYAVQHKNCWFVVLYSDDGYVDPAELEKLKREDRPRITAAIAEAHLIEPPLDITVKSDPEMWTERLGAKRLPTGSLRRTSGGDIRNLPGFAQGAWWVQDAAAALPARLLGDVSGQTVFDLCAAPGGKTAQLAAAGPRISMRLRHSRRVRKRGRRWRVVTGKSISNRRRET